jgi:hypothetical protein
VVGRIRVQGRGPKGGGGLVGVKAEGTCTGSVACTVDRLVWLARLAGWLADPGNGPMDPSHRVMNNVIIYFIIIYLSLK